MKTHYKNIVYLHRSEAKANPFFTLFTFTKCAAEFPKNTRVLIISFASFLKYFPIVTYGCPLTTDYKCVYLPCQDIFCFLWISGKLSFNAFVFDIYDPVTAPCDLRIVRGNDYRTVSRFRQRAEYPHHFASILDIKRACGLICQYYLFIV